MSLLFASIRLGALGSESQEGQNFAITRLRKRANQPLTTKSPRGLSSVTALIRFSIVAHLDRTQAPTVWRPYSSSNQIASSIVVSVASISVWIAVPVTVGVAICAGQTETQTNPKSRGAEAAAPESATPKSAAMETSTMEASATPVKSATASVTSSATGRGYSR
jgi:hypothetical protein